MALRSDDVSINTIIGDGSAVSGNVRVNGFIRIDGDINGNLETDGNVIVGEKARLYGSIKAKSVIIGGIVIGDILAKEGVSLLSTAAVIGDIISRKVQMEDKVVFHGYCISLSNEEKFTAESERYLQAKAIRRKVSPA
jgi:cytoskeletal protein CcmA (bactofilin family)